MFNNADDNHCHHRDNNTTVLGMWVWYHYDLWMVVVHINMWVVTISYSLYCTNSIAGCSCCKILILSLVKLLWDDRNMLGEFWINFINAVWGMANGNNCVLRSKMDQEPWMVKQYPSQDFTATFVNQKLFWIYCIVDNILQKNVGHLSNIIIKDKQPWIIHVDFF